MMKKLLIVALAALLTQSAFAVNLVLTDQVMDMDDPMYDRVDEAGSLDPNGLQVNYHVLDFYVTISGTYDLEMAVKTTNDASDTYFFVYDGALNPADATENFLAGNDDSAAVLTVLSGTYRSGSSGRSRIGGFALTANHQYQAVMTTFSFADTFFEEMTYDLGIGNGQGDVLPGAPVPEPATMLVLGAGTMVAMLRRRRMQK